MAVSTLKRWLSVLEAMNQFMEKNDKGYLIYKGKTFLYPDPVKILPYDVYLSREK
jgi:hypothetical protein